MRQEYYDIAPQMSYYHRAPRVYAPYIMEMSAPNYSSPCFSTDEFGFRTTIYKGNRLTLRAYRELIDRPRAAIFGNSTAFGVGTTSDSLTIPSHLNRNTQFLWFNFSGRTFQSTQELLCYLLFAPEGIEKIVIISGINNFDMSYRWFSDDTIYLPPFYNQRPFLSAYFDKEIEPKGFLRRLIGRIVRRLSTTNNQYDFGYFFTEEVKNRFFPQTVDLALLLKDGSSINRSLLRLEMDIKKWSALFTRRSKRIVYILQPIVDWTHKKLSYEEKILLQYVEEERGEKWKRVSRFLSDKEEFYRESVRHICEKHGVLFYDANEFSFFKGEEWIFLDRYHITDLAHELLSNFIANEVINVEG